MALLPALQSVSVRTQEVGLQMAVGAESIDVLGART